MANSRVLETAIFPGPFTLAEADELVAAGVTRIELCCVTHRFDYHNPTVVREMQNGLKARGIAIPSTHLPFGPACDISSLNRNRRTEAIDELAAAAEISQELGATVLVLHPGIHLESGDDRRKRLDMAADSLLRLSDRLPRSGCCLAVENLLPGYLGDNAVELSELIKKTGDDRIGFCLDTGHAHLTGEITALLDRCGGFLFNLHLHDNAGDGDRHLAPGRGSIDWLSLATVLKRLNYQGPHTWEIVNESDPAVRATIIQQFLGAGDDFRRCDNGATA